MRKKIFAKHITHKVHVSRMYKDFLVFNKKKKDHSFKNWHKTRVDMLPKKIVYGW